MKKMILFWSCLALLTAGAAPVFSAADPTTLTVKGSDTMIHLAADWAEAFMKKNPQSSVQVTGGGSGTGISALLNGTTDICTASRELKKDEVQQFQTKGIKFREYTVALDGVAVVVHPSNPLEHITMDQLRQVFTGEIASWKQLGGADRPIVLYSRESSSGTYVFFQEHVLNKKDYAKHARLLPATSGIVQAVASDRTAIGYIGFGYLAESRKDGSSHLKALKVKKDKLAPAVIASEETVKSGQYPISRPLHFYARENLGTLGQQFIDFCLGPAGQHIVRSAGYVPVGNRAEKKR